MTDHTCAAGEAVNTQKSDSIAEQTALSTRMTWSEIVATTARNLATCLNEREKHLHHLLAVVY
jgi:hypothetical protein